MPRMQGRDTCCSNLITNPNPIPKPVAVQIAPLRTSEQSAHCKFFYGFDAFAGTVT